MGKRVSAVAVLLATSFLGSLLALVLVGRNPLVGPSSDLARTESLQDGVEGPPVTVPGGSSPSASTTSGGSEAVDEAVRSATEAGPLETAYRSGPAAQAESAPGAAPSADGEPVQPAEEDDASLAKTISEAGDDQGNGNGKANGHDKEKSGHAPDDEPKVDASDDAVEGSSGGPKGKPTGPKEPKDSKGENDGSAPGEKSKGSGKGPKVEKAKGSGEGASEPPGKTKSKT